MPKPVTVDIVMPVHNRWKMTKQSLDSLFAHTRYDQFNLYVIDDGSDEEQYLQLHKYWLETDRMFEFSLYRNKVAQAPGPSRNWICQEITKHDWRSRYLYHSDNDVYFTPSWLQKLIDVFELANNHHPVKLLGGGCHPYLQNKSVITDPTGFSNWRAGVKDAVSGYSQLMTWETWEKYGPFDETMRNADIKIMGSEDWAFCQKIVKDGGIVASIEPEVVIHCGKTNTYGNPATGNETFKKIEGIIIE